MISDKEGFLCPEVDTEYCDNCGACRRVCPIVQLRSTDDAFATEVYACWNKDEDIRFQSASGGAFSALAQHVLSCGGVVFGAAFDEDMRVKHVAVHRKEELWKLRSTKYVQSDVGLSYQVVRELLQKERKVLFTGTPCQVAAISALLGKEHGNLFLCDIICKGVPSPGLFAKYVKQLETYYGAKLININVRHKLIDWEFPSSVALFDDGQKRVLKGPSDSFMNGYRNYYTLRTCCYNCPFASVSRFGDITLADFWGIGDLAPFQHSTRNGVSLILVNTDKGRRLVKSSSDRLYLEERTLAEAKNKQPHMAKSLRKPKTRDGFFADYQMLEYEALARKHLVDKGAKGLVKRVVPRTWIFYMQKSIKRIRG